MVIMHVLAPSLTVGQDGKRGMVGMSGVVS